MFRPPAGLLGPRAACAFKMPPGLLEPGPALLHAIDVTIATDNQEFAGHQSREQRVGMRGIGPEIQEEEACLGTGHVTSAAE